MTTQTTPASGSMAGHFAAAEIEIIKAIAADAKTAQKTPAAVPSLTTRFRAFVIRLLHKTRAGVQDAAGKATATATAAGRAAAADDLLTAVTPFGPTDARDVVVSAGVRLPELERVILGQATGLHADVLRAATGSVLSPGSTEVERLALAQRMLDDFAKRGITAYVDKAGRRWSLTAYVEMSTRTALRQLANDTYLSVAANAGHDLVRVTVVPNCSPMCAPYQGGLLSITGATMWSPLGEGLRVPTVAEARAHGFEHPSCRHRMIVWRPGDPVPIPPAIDPEDYRNTQRLRALERALRATRRELAAAMTPQAEQRANTRIRALQARIRRIADTTPAPRMRRRELVGIAR